MTKAHIGKLRRAWSVGLVAALVVVLGACASSRGRRVYARTPVPFLAEPQVRSILARYSPRGRAIVAKYESLPAEFILPEGGYRLSSPDNFGSYLRGRTAATLVTRIVTGVHEITHGYCTRVGFEELARHRLGFGAGACAVLSDGPPTLVRFTETFPSREIAPTFPAAARTRRFGVYVDNGDATQATQVYGVYGLLDEYAASLQGNRTLVDFWPWIRDAAPRDARVADNYAVALDDALVAHDEFRSFILHYLVHAQRQNRPVFDRVMGNLSFREAYRRVETTYGRLVATIVALEPQVHRWAASLGTMIRRQGVLIAIDGRLMDARSGRPREQLRMLLADPQIQLIRNQLVYGVVLPSWP